MPALPFTSLTTNNTGHTDKVTNGTTNISDFFPLSAGLTGINQSGNFFYVHVLIITFCVLVIFTLCLGWARSVVAHLRHASVVANPREQSFWTQNRTKWWPWLKEHFLYAPIWKVRHNREIQISSAISIGTLPSRGQMILLVVYGICNLAYCLAIPYNTSIETTMAALRGRTGTLSALNMVPTVLFALRNNPLIWILNVPYDTFNLFHRWIARISILQAVLHVVFWAINTVLQGGWNAIYQSLTTGSHAVSFTNGFVSTIILIVLACLAWSPLRHAFYETFLNIHKLAVTAALATAYMHLKVDRLPQYPWIELVFLLWILEYVVRIVRILYHNISTTHRFTRITVEALPAEACRVTLELARPWSSRPGTHVHLYIPTLSWLSSHPFSVAWTDVLPQHTELPTVNIEKASFSDPSPNLNIITNQVTTITLICRARTGFTGRLFDRALAQSKRTWYTWGFVEGPYGTADSLSSYGTVLLFAGGVGITHQLSYLAPLIAGFRDSTVATRKITLVWSVPSADGLEWIKPWINRLLQIKGAKEVLKIVVFVTKPGKKEELSCGLENMLMYPGRCDPGTFIDKEAAERIGAMVVTVCGPGAFADEVRKSVRRRVNVGVVDFKEEAFTY